MSFALRKRCSILRNWVRDMWQGFGVQEVLQRAVVFMCVGYGCASYVLHVELVPNDTTCTHNILLNQEWSIDIQ